MKWIVYQGTDGEWRWRLVASNGRIVAVSSEGYQRIGDALSALEIVRGAGDAPVVHATAD